MNSLILSVSFWGVIGSIFAYRCAKGHAENLDDTLFFGTRVPWAVVGILGYILIGATSGFPVITKVLAVTVALATIFLMVKAVRLRLFCPGCVFVWAINVAFVFLAFTNNPQES